MLVAGCYLSWSLLHDHFGMVREYWLLVASCWVAAYHGRCYMITLEWFPSTSYWLLVAGLLPIMFVATSSVSNGSRVLVTGYGSWVATYHGRCFMISLE